MLLFILHAHQLGDKLYIVFDVSNHEVYTFLLIKLQMQNCMVFKYQFMLNSQNTVGFTFLGLLYNLRFIQKYPVCILKLT